VAPNVNITLEGKRLVMRFPYDVRMITLVKQTGATYRGPNSGERPHWSLPAEITSLRRIRSELGPFCVLDPNARRWERRILADERRAAKHSTSEVELLSVPPRMYRYARPYQKADIAFMAERSCVNANEVGMGKTFETIAAAAEAGLRDGPHLVVAGVTHLLNVWLPALRRHERRIRVGVGATLPTRRQSVTEALSWAEAGETFWLLVNHAMLRTHAAELSSIPWQVAVIDEYRKVGLSNPKSLLAQGARKIKAERRWALSGTPMGGRLWNLWGALNWVDPKAFPSRWRWMEQWGESKPNWFAASGKSFSGRLAHGREEELYLSLAPYLLRRRKREHMPELPPIIWNDPTWCDMTGAQRRMYNELTQWGEIRVGSEYRAVTGALAELTRAKQLATATLTRRAMSANSGKLPALLENLDELGIRGDDPEGDEKAVIVSQFKQMFPAWRRAIPFPTLQMTGSYSPAERAQINQRFQSDKGPRVLFLTYGLASGIDLDRANSIHVIDETWDPDDLEQAVGRLDRGRPHPITVYRYLSRESVDEYVDEIGTGKRLTNEEVLEVYRLAFRRAKSS
jgi:SNF2 family DNA or RNA helicase